MSKIQIQKGEVIEITIDKLILGGQGIGRIDSLVVFVWDSLPGEKIRAKVTKIKRNYIEAEKVELLKASKDAIEAKCSWFSVCGGCKYQNIPYEKQLELKQEHIRDSLERIGGFSFTGEGENIKMKEIIPSPKQWYYRNKIELSVGLGIDGQTEIGFHKSKDYETILSMTECCIFDEKLSEILVAFRKYIKAEKYEHFDLKDNPDGFLQYIVLRKSELNGELQVNMITREGELKNINSLIEDLLVIKPKLSFFQTVNLGGVGYSHHGDKELVRLYGEASLTERLDDLSFKISPFSFFQTNTLGAEKLYQVVRDFADLTGKEKVLDLYCGTGTIGQFLAKKAKIVQGIELIPEAISSAEENCKLNALNNCAYICGDTRKILKFNRDDYLDTDVIITDPPRSGMVPKALRRMIEIRAKKIIYVSCNPSMLARDLKEITTAGYEIINIQAVDMFPHTAHVETVVELKNISNSNHF